MEFRGAKLFLFIGSRLVILERDDIPTIPWPGYLDLPGGARDGDETAEACVLRETREEIGLTLMTKSLVWTHAFNEGVYFAAHLAGGAESEIVFGNEGIGWRMMAPEDYTAHPMVIPHHADLLQIYLSTRP